MFRTLAAALATSTCIVALATPAAAQTREYDIPAGSLKSALDAYVRQSGRQVVYRADQVRSARSPGTRGQQSPEAALSAILSGSGFMTRVDGNLVAIVKAGNGSVAEAPSLGEGAVVETGEIIVTAQKRNERLQDVPSSVTVVSPAALLESNQLRLQDYFNKIPGLTLTPTTQSGQILSLRGVTTGSGNPTVAIVVDDVPYGSATFLGGGNVVPDIDPNDLARIEVLRGPQGALYGVSSIGGLIKYVTVDPSTSAVSGRIEGTIDGVKNGDRVGFGFRGSVNVPLTDTLAIRASGFHRNDPGYINNVVTGRDGVNQADATGGRVAALWKASNAITIKLSALLQEIKGDGSSVVHPATGDLMQVYVAGTGAYNRRVEAYSGTVQIDLGGPTLTSLTGYNVNEFTDSFDGTYIYGTNTGFFNNNVTKRLSQELRLGDEGRVLDWQVGGYYTDEDSTLHQDRHDLDAAGNQTTNIYRAILPTSYKEYAAFANATYHVSDKFDLQAGGRKAWIKQRYSLTFNGTVLDTQAATSDAFTYLITARYKPNPNLTLYARAASGYRAGGTNAVVPGSSAPRGFDPDRTQDYEVGVKGSFLDRKVTVDIAVYQIDWKNIQILSTDSATNTTFTGNGAQARSRGIDFSFGIRPMEGALISGWAAYNDSELTENFPATSPLVGFKGDRLPYSAHFSGNLSLDQQIPINADITGRIGGALTYVGKRFMGIGGGDELPHYAKLDLTASIENASWKATIFATNITDKRGIVNTGLEGTRRASYYIPPRTIGLSISKSF